MNRSRCWTFFLALNVIMILEGAVFLLSVLYSSTSRVLYQRLREINSPSPRASDELSPFRCKLHRRKNSNTVAIVASLERIVAVIGYACNVALPFAMWLKVRDSAHCSPRKFIST